MSVTPIAVPPKTITRSYRGQEVVIKFDPTSKRWAWHFAIKSSIEYAGKAPTPDKAMRDAQKRMDQIYGK